MSVLDVHNLIADIVGGFDEEDQRMAAIAFVGIVEREDAEFVHDAAEGRGLALEVAELGFAAGVVGGIRILDDGS
jgi:hypothetical protein